MNNPRQWKIAQSKYDAHDCIFHDRPSEQWIKEQVKMDAWEVIDVIEKSAYDELQNKLTILLEALKNI